MELFKFVFDVSNYPKGTGYDDPETVKYLLTAIQSYFNDRLILDRRVFLSDVLQRLGITPIAYTYCVGWENSGAGNGYIDFGIGEVFDTHNVELNFNCDGYIL